jgi:hypothetical protein
MDGLLLKYFVLKPRGGSPYEEASRAAMLTYAKVIKKENPQLAKDLREWVKQTSIV